jgi:hypothetical protein
MSHNPRHPSTGERDSTNDRPEPAATERVEELAWALADESITADELQLLETLLMRDEAARRAYIECMSLHAGLFAHYRQDEGASSRSPVLGFLGEVAPGLALESPSTEDTAT